MSQSAFKKYSIDQLPNDPSQITSGFVTDTFNGGGPDFSGDIYYEKVGKLYFNFQTTGGGLNGCICVTGGGQSNADNADRIASLLGLTVNTVYEVNTSLGGSNNVVYRAGYNSGKWNDQGSQVGPMLTAFLAN